MTSIVVQCRLLETEQVPDEEVNRVSKVVTIRLKDSVYELFRTLAERDNRPLSNFIETAALRYVEHEEYADEFEMREIRDNGSLKESIERGLADAKGKRGRFV